MHLINDGMFAVLLLYFSVLTTFLQTLKYGLKP